VPAQPCRPDRLTAAGPTGDRGVDRARMHVYHETERLILRRFTTDDLDALTALDADPAVMRYINGGRPTPREEIRGDYLPWWLAYYDRGDRYGFWAAIERTSGAFLGWFHLRPQEGDADDEPELGYRLRADAWGKGYATEGSRALVEKAFIELGARRVYATTMVVNSASWRVMEKAGLRRVRVFLADWPDRIEGEEHGDVEYALTRDEWLAARARGTGPVGEVAPSRTGRRSQRRT
jgi:RimJ/RimL family protein N-acetyltransferase